MSTVSSFDFSAFSPRLYSPSVPDRAGPKKTGPDLSPRMTLREFFELWFLPEVLVESRGSRKATILLYQDAIRWWEALTSNPPVEAVDIATIREFKRALGLATYRRSPRGEVRSLSGHTQTKILRMIRTVIYHLGQSTDRTRLTSGLLDDVPHLSISRLKCQVKATFDVSTARDLVSACQQMKWPARYWKAAPKFRPDFGAPEFFSMLLQSFYFLGFRKVTNLSIKRHMLDQQNVFRTWIDVPEEDVSKTYQPVRKFVHPDLVAAWLNLGTARPELNPWPFSITHLDDCHNQLQAIAGIAPERRLSIHAWKRLHVQEMGKLGMGFAMDIARQSAHHASVQTTAESYANLEPLFIMQLPRLIDVQP